MHWSYVFLALTHSDIAVCCRQAITWTQWWFLNDVILWHSLKMNFTESAQATILYNEFKTYTFEITTSPRDRWVNVSIHFHQMSSVNLVGIVVQNYWKFVGCFSKSVIIASSIDNRKVPIGTSLLLIFDAIIIVILNSSFFTNWKHFISHCVMLIIKVLWSTCSA